jgi:hypothetical protein
MSFHFLVEWKKKDAVDSSQEVCTSEQPPSIEGGTAAEESLVLSQESTQIPELTAQPPALTQKRRGLQAVIRGGYTALFTLLGMSGAAFAALRDNLSQLTDLKLQTILIVVGGALLAGVAYGLKRWYKPEGLL